jgi:mannitol-1-/sugar-/sorbitol-6-phosphatase
MQKIGKSSAWRSKTSKELWLYPEPRSSCALSANRYAIVTSATRPLAEVRLRAAGFSIPENLVTARDAKRGKPNPDPYLMGAKILGVPPAECVVIEDAPSGVRAGKAAGARVVALRTTASDAELQEAGADWIVDDCAELMLYFKSSGKAFFLLSRRTN